MGQKLGSVLNWVAAGIILAFAVIYLALIAAQDGPEPGEAGSVFTWAGSLLVAAVVSASAAMVRRRAAAVGLLSFALLILVAWIALAILSVGVLFLVPAAVIVAALVRTAQAGPADHPTAWDESVEKRPDLPGRHGVTPRDARRRRRDVHGRR